MLAPNGKPSNIQNIELWRTIRHPNFLKWFGDWIKAATDANILTGDAINSLYDKDRGFDYDKARRIARTLVSGTGQAIGLNERGERGRILGGSRNVEASLLLTANESAGPTAARGEQRFNDIGRAEKLLEKWARSGNDWINEDEYSRKHGYLRSGKEVNVYVGELTEPSEPKSSAVRKTGRAHPNREKRIARTFTISCDPSG